MKKLLFAFIFFYTSIFSASKVDVVLKDSSAKEVSFSKVLHNALALTREINFEQYGEVMAVSWDSRFAVCLREDTINLIDVANGNLLWKIKKSCSVPHGGISKNNRFILIYDHDACSYQILDLNNGDLIFSYKLLLQNFDKLFFSDDSKFVIINCYGTKIELIDLDAKKLFECDALVNRKPGIFVTYDKKIISCLPGVPRCAGEVLGVEQKSEVEQQYDRIIISDFQGRIVKVIPIQSEEYFNRLFAISSDNKFAIIGGVVKVFIVSLVTGKILKCIDLRKYGIFSSISSNNEFIASISMSSDNNFILVGAGNAAGVIDLNSEKLLHTIRLSQKVEFLSISSDNRFVNVISSNVNSLSRVIKIIDLKPDIIKDPFQIKLINWMYAKKMNSTIDAEVIELNEEQALVFFTLDEIVHKSLSNDYNLKIYGIKATFADAIKYPWSMHTQFEQSNLPQSKRHVICFRTNLLIRSILKDKVNKEFFLKIYAQEKVEHSNSDYVFLHGREWRWNFLSDIYKQLRNITKNEYVTNYEFLRFGVPGKNRTGQDILFMNSAIFGNCTNEGSCTAYYWHANFDQSSSKDLIGTSNVFKAFKLEEVYRKYAASLKELEELHKQCSKRGEILLISVPKSMLKHVICTQTGGGIKQVLVNGKLTSDTQTILDTIKDPKQTVNKFDNLEWGLVLGTFDNKGKYTVNPDTNDPNKGISIYSFHDADEKMMHEYEKMRDEIFAKIRADLKAKPAPMIKSKL